jgi:peptide-methionine (S)-S-oxide reductase
MLFARKPLTTPSAAEALPGRPRPIPTAERHFVNGRNLHEPYPEGHEKALFGLCGRPHAEPHL